MSKFKVGDIVIFSHPDREAEGVRTYWAKKICNLGFEYKVNNIHQDGSIHINGDLNSYWCNAGQFTLKSQYDMQNKTEIKRIPFDIERAKKGEKVIYRHGNNARILCCDAPEYSGQCVISMDEKGQIRRHFPSGLFTHDTESLNDLFMAPIEKTGWINLHKDILLHCHVSHAFETEQEALKAKGIGYICTKQITWEE